MTFASKTRGYPSFPCRPPPASAIPNQNDRLRLEDIAVGFDGVHGIVEILDGHIHIEIDQLTP